MSFKNKKKMSEEENLPFQKIDEFIIITDYTHETNNQSNILEPNPDSVQEVKGTAFVHQTPPVSIEITELNNDDQNKELNNDETSIISPVTTTTDGKTVLLPLESQKSEPTITTEQNSNPSINPTDNSSTKQNPSSSSRQHQNRLDYFMELCCCCCYYKMKNN